MFGLHSRRLFTQMFGVLDMSQKLYFYILNCVFFPWLLFCGQADCNVTQDFSHYKE
ncbi:Protein CBG27878 [Caenorhabditis briggsae]|uniref:Protein CBG27878 n=1 Tax=Caenorhabditis briggsae TaxID=6238 RepID=B6IEH3_CAEBR|nr:Protein CBG27878 [Caenorhabditis briggsae]CAR98303.1 Protein CBG27878 [Caenorhabditis briggsae]